MMRPMIRLILSLAILSGLGAAAWAAEGVARFMGFEVKPQAGRVLVLRDFSPRAKPDNDGKPLKALEKGQRVQTVGRTPQSGWLAIKDDKGKDLGFIHESATVPLLSGKLDKDIRAQGTTADGTPCEYVARFEGTTPVEEEGFDTADYDLWFRCDLGTPKKPVLRASMFITEAPYQMVRGGEHQVALDLLELHGTGDDTVLTTNLFYDMDKARLRYDGASQPKLVQAPAVKEKAVTDIRSILSAAVEMTLSSWTRKTLDQVRN